MNATDLIVIYLACGSPFAVFQATNRQMGVAGVNWQRVIMSFIFWPFFAASALASKIFPNEASRKAAFQSRVEDIRIDLEQTAFAGKAISSLFEFRETFYRYVGLSEATDEIQTSRSSAEIFEISSHINKPLATLCLARQNARKLSYHRTSARQEFVGLISRLTETGADRIEVASLALELADLLHDQTAADAFQSMISVPETMDGEWISGLEKEVWKSRTPSISTINSTETIRTNPSPIT